jgi:SAM-dependent methyltransferase
MRILEIGPDLIPSTYQRLLQHLSLEWHTLDMCDRPNLTFPNSGEYSFPIPNDYYDIVISANVIEHVRKPWKWIPELARVARSDGLIITINPVSWVFHEAPVDCWRIYPEGVKALYEDASLWVVLSRWESLETPQFRSFIPGISRSSQSRRTRFWYSILGRLGFPVERSYDTVTIGRKYFSSDGGTVVLPTDFNPDRYLELNPDVANAGADPATHWKEYGYREGRRWQ